MDTTNKVAHDSSNIQSLRKKNIMTVETRGVNESNKFYENLVTWSDSLQEQYRNHSQSRSNPTFHIDNKTSSSESDDDDDDDDDDYEEENDGVEIERFDEKLHLSHSTNQRSRYYDPSHRKQRRSFILDKIISHHDLFTCGPSTCDAVGDGSYDDQPSSGCIAPTATVRQGDRNRNEMEEVPSFRRSHYLDHMGECFNPLRRKGSTVHDDLDDIHSIALSNRQKEELRHLSRMTSWDTQGTSSTCESMITQSSMLLNSNAGLTGANTEEDAAFEQGMLVFDDEGHAIPTHILRSHHRIRMRIAAETMAALKSSSVDSITAHQEQTNDRNCGKVPYTSAPLLAINETTTYDRNTSNHGDNNSARTRRKKLVKFEYPPVSSLRQYPRISSTDKERLFFTEEELDQLDDDRKLTVGDHFEIVAHDHESPLMISAITQSSSYDDDSSDVHEDTGTSQSNTFSSPPELLSSSYSDSPSKDVSSSSSSSLSSTILQAHRRSVPSPALSSVKSILKSSRRDKSRTPNMSTSVSEPRSETFFSSSDDDSESSSCVHLVLRSVADSNFQKSTVDHEVQSVDSIPENAAQPHNVTIQKSLSNRRLSGIRLFMRQRHYEG